VSSVVGLLLKGGVVNFLHSLRDYVERRSLAARFPPGVFLWGARSRSSLYVEGVKVLLYLSKSEYGPGGVALFGTLERPVELRERYWPEGEWLILLPIRVVNFARGVLENLDNPRAWKLVTREVLAQLGVKVLPGPQKIDDKVVEEIVKLM